MIIDGISSRIVTRQWKALEEVADLKLRVDEAVSHFQKIYTETLNTVENLKERMNRLELSISRKGCKADEQMEELNSTIDHLNKLTDSLISRSKEMWKGYNILEHDCKAKKLEDNELDHLRVLCEKTEQLAADLLCYSLAHFERASS
jgi:predicted RecB family endonuclease